VVLCVDEEDDAGDFGEVVAPEAAGWKRSVSRLFVGLFVWRRGCGYQYLVDGLLGRRL
jgi:hypothetical protein